jgi:hypothetical protein
MLFHPDCWVWNRFTIRKKKEETSSKDYFLAEGSLTWYNASLILVILVRSNL